MKRPRIGIPQRDYNARRNILDSRPAWADAVRPVDRHRVTTAVRARLRLQRDNFHAATLSEPYFPRADLLHLFNAVAFTRTPWLSTFETMLPRWGNVVLPHWDIPDRVMARAIEAMAGDACRGVIAISESARRLLARRWNERLGTRTAGALARKVTVLRPPQAVIADASERRYGNDPKLAFIGSEFYRKGGLAFLEALARLHGRGKRGWSAVLVGRLDSHGDHASRSTPADAERARALMARMGPAVSHVPALPRADVLRLLSDADWFVLPTLQDSFGYGVLEAQACGALTLTTNVRAMPEMHCADGGMMVELALDADGEVHHDARAMPAVIADLVDRLEVALDVALSMPAGTRQARAIAQQRLLRERFDPATHAASIERLYRDALGEGHP